jgi:hypothetical protein
MASRGIAWSQANQWPSTTTSNQFYTDFILYPKKPLYFKYVKKPLRPCIEPDDETQSTTENGSSGWDMYANKCAGAMYVVSIVGVAGEDDYCALVFKVIVPELVKPAAVLSGQMENLKPVLKMSFSTPCAMSKWIWTFCIGYFVAVTTRLGCTMLRAPRFSGDYDNYCLYQANDELGVPDGKDNWISPGPAAIDEENTPLYFTNTPLSSGTCCPCPFQPINLKPVGVNRDFESLFIAIGDILCSQKQVPTSFLVASERKYERLCSGQVLFEGLQVCNEQTPWLNNPLTFKN